MWWYSLDISLSSWKCELTRGVAEQQVPAEKVEELD